MATTTRTVLFTDLADYTAAVSRSDREGLRKLLASHEATVAPVVMRYQGVVVKNIGDSFMCLFAAATDALRAALDLQDALDRGDGRLRIRVGLTTGDVEEIDGDAFGDPVNQAARIMAKAEPGEIWFGPGTRACMNAAEIPWELVGNFQLKGIPGEVTLYRAVPLRRCKLPDQVVNAIRARRLVRVRRGLEHGVITADTTVLLEGYLPGSGELQEVLAQIPVVDPENIWLATYHISPEDRFAWTGLGRGLVIGTADALERAIEAERRPSKRRTSADTMIFDFGNAPVIGLVDSGIALPSVPLSDIIAGYHFVLTPEGTWAYDDEKPGAVLEVDPHGVSLRAAAPGILLSGRALSVGERVPLRHLSELTAYGQRWTWRALSETYAGVLIGASGSPVALHDGAMIEMGREPATSGMAFLERPGTFHVQWCSGPRAAAAKAGHFTLDRALIGRRQAVVRVEGHRVNVVQIHERCPTWLWSGSSQSLVRVGQTQEAQIGDAVITGTRVLSIVDASAA